MSFITAGIFFLVPGLSDVLIQLSVKSRNHNKMESKEHFSFFVVVTGKQLKYLGTQTNLKGKGKESRNIKLVGFSCDEWGW